MTVIPKLASSLKRRDEVPNQELAKQMAAKNDKAGVKELVDHLSHKSKDIQNDCIKVLYEIGYLKPALISAYTKEFLGLLKHKNNRLQWGGMTALNCITPEDPKLIYGLLPKIIDAANNGSVITRDQAVSILIKLCSVKQYADAAFSLLVEQLLKCPVNQLPMYADNAAPVISDKNKPKFITTLLSRFDDLEKDTQRKRIEKVIKKYGSL